MKNLQRIADLHELPESHEVSKRAKISLAHIPTAKIFSRHLAKLDAITKREALGLIGAQFTVGQSVRTNLGKRGPIVAISGNSVSIDVNGDVKKYHASTIKLV